MASNSRAHPIVHRRASSDSMAIMNKHLMAPDRDILSLKNHDKNPSSGKEVMLLPDSSITVESEAPNRGPNPVPEPMDLKTKRLLANRESAKRSRLRKQVYLENLKKEKDFQQARVCMLKPQIGYYENHRQALMIENNALKEMLAAFEILKLNKEAEYRAFVEERDALLAVFMRQTGN